MQTHAQTPRTRDGPNENRKTVVYQCGNCFPLADLRPDNVQNFVSDTILLASGGRLACMDGSRPNPAVYRVQEPAGGCLDGPLLSTKLS